MISRLAWNYSAKNWLNLSVTADTALVFITLLYMPRSIKQIRKYFPRTQSGAKQDQHTNSCITCALYSRLGTTTTATAAMKADATGNVRMITIWRGTGWSRARWVGPLLPGHTTLVLFPRKAPSERRLLPNSGAPYAQIVQSNLSWLEHKSLKMNSSWADVGFRARGWAWDGLLAW